MKGKIAEIIFLSLLAAAAMACGTEQENNSSSLSGDLDISSDEEEIEITLPEDLDLTVDYTSVKGIQVEKGFYLAIVGKNLDSGYCDAVKEGAACAIEDINAELGYQGDDEVHMTFEGPSDSIDIDSQINTIDTVLAENPGALCLAAIDVQSCEAQLEIARDNGIPVIILDSGVDSDLVTCSCVTDNRSAAALAAEKLSEAIDDEGQIIIMSHVQSTETSEDRVAGFREELEENYPDVEIVNISYENEDMSIEDMLLKALEQYPAVKGIFCTNESVTENVLDTVAGMNKDDLKIVGFDSGEKQIQAIMDGTEYGSVCQNPYAMGYAAVVAALRAASGQSVDSWIDPGYQWIDQNNISLEENRKYLYL